MKLFIVLAAIVACAFAGPIESEDAYLDEDVPLAENGLAALLAEHGGMVPMGEGNGRIVGGDAVSINNFPFTLSLRRLGSHRCGASLIRANRALCAAHCTVGIGGTGFELRAGSTQHASGGQIQTSTSVLNHPSYNANTLNNDISIVRVGANFNTGLAGIAVIGLHAAGAGVAAGSTVTVAGWGATCEGCAGSAGLRAVSKPVVANAQCNTNYGGGITAQMLCAGFAAGGRDACQGDSGGPLVQGNTLVGVVSWGRGCARPNLPGVYARVASFTTWINNNV
ncbi:trypsin-like isoform X1 [Bradysia coprophila]|uniref:trypsin-like isoform X1 n=2 Tax=Bradysia coprophila TaxID=38358 RepID=UPI00187DC906|nr:trypsin-like isoform X1 [Bradysia coprophila]